MAAVAKGRRRCHVVLDSEDVEWMNEIFGDSIGFSGGMRAMLKSFRKKIEATAAQQMQRPQASHDKELAKEVEAQAAIGAGTEDE